MASLSVTIQANGVVVAPGSSAAFSVEVRNLSSVVDRYRCELVGIDPNWVSITPASLELFPDARDAPARGANPPSVGQFSVVLHPPKTPEAVAGPWPIGAKVTSEHDPAGRVVEETTVSILPFGALTADLHPAIASGRSGARATVQVTNDGNRPEVVTLAGSDPADKIAFEFRPPTANLAPGESLGVSTRMAGGGLKLLGGTETRPFRIDVRASSPGTSPHTLNGTFERKPLVPSGLPAALAIVAALALGAAAVFSLTRPPSPPDSHAIVSPSAPASAVVPTPSPTAPPTATPTGSPTASPTISPTPPPTPTPTPTAPADLCIQGYVWREAFVGDHVCVTGEERQRVADDNAAAASRVDPSGPYGPNSCVSGYVWRVARPDDLVCVTGEERQQVADDNAAAASRIAPPPS